ncbi:MAG: hypothetical protein ACHQ7M_08885 [Chloroflexota bacterium]
MQPTPITHHEIVLNDPTRPVTCPIYDRDLLAPGEEVSGPALIWEYASTTLLFAGDRLRMASTGEMIVEIGSE